MPSKHPFILYFALITMGMGHTVVFAVLPLLGRELAYSELQINSLTACAALVYFIASPRWGRLSERFGRKPIIAIGLAGYAVGTVIFNGFALLGLQHVISGMLLFGFLMLARVATVALMSATQPAALAYMADITDADKRTAGMSKLVTANGVGNMLGPTLTLFAGFGLLMPMWIQAGLTLLASVLIWLYLQETRQPSMNKSVAVVKLSYLDQRYRNYLFIGLFVYIMMGVVQQTLAYYFQDKLGLDSIQAARFYGIAMACSSATMLLMQLFVVQRMSWQPKTFMMIGLPLAVFAYAFLALASEFWQLSLAMIIYGASMGLFGPGFSAAASLRVSRNEQGSLAGLVASAPGLGFVIGPLLGALCYRWDITAPYWFAAASILLLLLFLPILLSSQVMEDNKPG